MMTSLISKFISRIEFTNDNLFNLESRSAKKDVSSLTRNENKAKVNVSSSMSNINNRLQSNNFVNVAKVNKRKSTTGEPEISFKIKRKNNINISSSTKKYRLYRSISDFLSYVACCKTEGNLTIKNAQSNVTSKINQCLSIETVTAKMHTIEILSAILLKEKDVGILEELYLKNMIKKTEGNYGDDVFNLSAEEIKSLFI